MLGRSTAADPVTTSVAASVDNLLEISNEVTDVSEESRSASSTIIKSLEEQLATVASVGLNYTFSSKNLDIEVVQLQEDFASNGVVFYLSENSPALVVPSEKYSSESVTELDTSLKLPAEAFDVGTVHREDGNVPSVFVLYKQSTLFSITSKGNKNWTIGSRVISANVHGMESNTFKNPVIGVYTPTINKSVSEQDIRCVFWDFKLENGIGDWSNEGCVYNTTEDGRVICHCDHLTNFAVLMDFHGQTDIISKRHHVLSVISLIGCCVSITALILTICTLIYTRYTTPFSREQHSARPKLVLLNFAIALFLLYLVFVVGIEQTTHKPACICISVLLHYLTISSISWMTIQAVNIYLSLVRIFPTYISKFRMKAYIFGWVIPVLPVVICLIVSRESYSNADYCFINPGPVLYYGNIAIAGALFFTNLVIFILVICVLTCSRSRQITRKNDKSKFATAKEQVSTAIGLSILLGLTWVFGFTAIAKSTSSNLRFSMQLLFCVFNSLQGLFVFLFFSVRPGDFKAFVTSCLSSLSCSTQSYEIANKYDKGVTLSHDTTGQAESMTHSTDV
ncbi:adhesion G-protein coupled receptor G6-like [Anneissia japonica]|uniref:adhesion G-protein coupled receptor G6-like n=1 Tax=Anneissia japonica TaxID=1529436 RepID=UPI001425A149|nr:adhesion G-protein coupled receptor G6-like [Anneissia japonica]